MTMLFSETFNAILACVRELSCGVGGCEQVYLDINALSMIMGKYLDDEGRKMVSIIAPGIPSAALNEVLTGWRSGCDLLAICFQ